MHALSLVLKTFAYCAGAIVLSCIRQPDHCGVRTVMFVSETVMFSEVLIQKSKYSISGPVSQIQSRLLWDILT